MVGAFGVDPAAARQRRVLPRPGRSVDDTDRRPTEGSAGHRADVAARSGEGSFCRGWPLIHRSGWSRLGSGKERGSWWVTYGENKIIDPPGIV